MNNPNVTVEYWKVPFDKCDDISNLLDSEFIKSNGTLADSYKVSYRNKFERLENEHWERDDAYYPHIIYGIFDNLGPEKYEITSGTPGMLEDWNIVRDSYDLAV